MMFDSLQALDMLQEALPKMLDWEVNVTRGNDGIETFTLGVFDNHMDLHRIRWQHSEDCGTRVRNEMFRTKLEELKREVE